MKYHVGMHDFICLGKANTSYIYCNNMQQWCGVVYELNLAFFDFVDDFLHYVTHLNKHFFRESGWTWRLVVILLFFHIGGGIIWCPKPTHINNPWFSIVIFIGLFIIIFIVINVQIGRVHKHGGRTSMIRSIPCPTILNDIFFNEISICKKNGNLMFAQVCTSFHAMPIHMCNKHTWWKEVRLCMSYSNVVGFVPSMYGWFRLNRISHGWHGCEGSMWPSHECSFSQCVS